MNISSIFKKSPLFYNWTQQKKVQEGELSILGEFKDFKLIQALLEWIVKHSPTHSEGLQILETGGELLLMNHNIQTFLKQNQKAEDLIKELKRLRYPISSVQQDRQKAILNQLALGRHFKIKALRQGDQSGLAIEFKSFQLTDLKQKIQKLELIYEQLKQKNFWKINP